MLRQSSCTKGIIYVFLGLGAALLIYCNTSNPSASEVASLYLNLQDSVQYVGMQTCQSCHSNVYHSFIKTGMGQSFDRATQDKTSAVFDEHAIVYDSLSDYFYKPYFEGEQMNVMEFRLRDGDTVHKRVEAIDYIVGSGHHTNSHIIDENGYIYQAPITYYTQEKRWDMAPGFDKENQRFSRFLTTECITCHNHLPDHVETSLNKYESMPTGIECERCHGPGEIHVREKLAGNIVDTSKYIDYSIVNPRDLPKDLQMDLCQRCHLQGIPVLVEGKTFFDFKPGMALSEVMNVYLPRYTNSHEQFIMASQADRLRLSACYQQSEMTCLTCHHPHHSVRTADKKSFNKPCQNCHQSASDVQCSAAMAERQAKEDNCAACHMPPSSSIDIPHIRITDHYISRVTDFNERQLSEQQQSDIAQFLGLQILTKDDPTPLEMAQGYIAMFDKNLQEAAILDSAFFYLSRSAAEDGGVPLSTWVHFYFARRDYTPIAKIAANRSAATIGDAWMAYRIGEAFFQLGDLHKSILYYKRATQLQKHNLDFQEKLGVAYLKTGSIPQAKQIFEFVLSEHPKRTMALNNLGLIYVQLQQLKKARELYHQALELDPDYVQALINLATLERYEGHEGVARQLLERAVRVDPDVTQRVIK